ncbi:hypothetical protein SCLCIDRAFT_1222762 [Scleroderma citrinum Foug A]|uniref:Secreted protein n=1 Tax=Scleroderma citrinum Foug A TaxID=1036808 RepID=A0A0C3CXZ3_9AGAM|nr:hypothetical protein SCLCIDRAFT_1222762 [Scleroderma citrinum Foug A]
MRGFCFSCGLCRILLSSLQALDCDENQAANQGNFYEFCGESIQHGTSCDQYTRGTRNPEGILLVFLMESPVPL